MQSWKIIAVALTAVIIGAVITASALAYYNGQQYYGPLSGSPNPYQNHGSSPYGGGMMGGGMGGMMGGGYQPYTSYPQQISQGQWGCGRMGNFGSAYPYNATSTPITINQAASIAQQYLLSLNNPDLAVREVQVYTLNFYVEYYERSTGIGAFEMLIDKYSGRIYPEMGPNMMWNTKYGNAMMGGIMDGYWGATNGTMTVIVTQSETLAQQYLNTNLPGTNVGDITPFYGYYDVEVLSAGKIYGMLSVNGYTGQVWYHTWHGNFIQELEL